MSNDIEGWKIYGITLSVLVVLSLIVYVFYFLSWECKNDSDCNSGEICNFKHRCIKPSYSSSNYIVESLIIAIAIIISVFIYTRNKKWSKLTRKMGEYKLFTTREFEKDFSNLDTWEQIRVNKILKHLKEQGEFVGKPLSGLSFFREKKLNGKRLYFLIYKDLRIVLILTISNKKTQQATINRILLDLVEYQQYVFDELKKRGII